MRVDLDKYILNLLVIIPLVIGLIRCRVIHKKYYIVLFNLALIFINELFIVFVYNYFLLNLFQFIYFLLYSLSLLLILFEWGFLNKRSIIKRVLIYVFIILSGLEYVLNIDQKVHLPIMIICILFIWVILAISFISSGIDFDDSSKNRRSKLLILVPMLISNIYFIVLNILVYFLFNPSTSPIFRKLYYLISYVDLFGYICFSLALLWAPKKQKYL